MLMFFGSIILIFFLLLLIALLFPMFFARLLMRSLGINPNNVKSTARNQSNTNSQANASSAGTSSTFNTGRAGNAHHETRSSGLQNGEKIFRSDEGQYVDYEEC